MTLFERVKKISKQKGYSSLKSLAEDAGLGVNAVYQWKNQTPRTDNLQAVADVLGVSVDYLLGNTDDMHANKKSNAKDTVDVEKDPTILSLDGIEITDEYRQFIIDQIRTIRKMRGDDK